MSFKSIDLRCPVLFLSIAVSTFACRAAEHGGAPPRATEVTVEVAKVVRTTLRAWVDAYGTVTPAPAGDGLPAGAALLSAPAAGVVTSVPVREGQHVEAGTVIVKLNDRMALAEVEDARQALQFAERQMQRQLSIEKIGAVSRKAIEEATRQLATARAQMKSAQGKLARVQLVSPLDGVVSRIVAQPGNSVDVNSIVAEIIDPRRVLATIKVAVDEAVALEVGQAAEVAVDGTGFASGARVSFVSPRVDPLLGTVLLRVSLPPGSPLRAGRFVHVRIAIAEHAGALCVPRAALYTGRDGTSSLSVVEDGLARRRRVEVGLKEGELVEVRGADLREGAVVVTAGSYALPDKTKVRVLETESHEVGRR